MKPISSYPLSFNSNKKHLRTWSEELRIQFNPLRMLISRSLCLPHSRLGTEVSLLILQKVHHYDYTLYLYIIFYILQTLKISFPIYIGKLWFLEVKLLVWDHSRGGKKVGPLEFWCIRFLLNSTTFLPSLICLLVPYLLWHRMPHSRR